MVRVGSKLSEDRVVKRSTTDDFLLSPFSLTSSSFFTRLVSFSSSSSSTFCAITAENQKRLAHYLFCCVSPAEADLPCHLNKYVVSLHGRDGSFPTLARVCEWVGRQEMKRKRGLFYSRHILISQTASSNHITSG